MSAPIATPDEDTLRHYLLGTLPPRAPANRSQFGWRPIPRKTGELLNRIAVRDRLTELLSEVATVGPGAGPVVERISNPRSRPARSRHVHGFAAAGGAGLLLVLFGPFQALPRGKRAPVCASCGCLLEGEAYRCPSCGADYGPPRGPVLPPNLHEYSDRPGDRPRRHGYGPRSSGRLAQSPRGSQGDAAGAAARSSCQGPLPARGPAAAMVEHDNVVPILHVEEDRGVPFIVMPLLQGESLQARLDRTGGLSVAQVIRLGREVATGLAATHGRRVGGMRDIKPANIWLDAGTDRARILDFGLAGRTDGADRLSESGEAVGTPAYMAPEQLDGQDVDARADLFSLGTTLYLRNGQSHSSVSITGPSSAPSSRTIRGRLRNWMPRSRRPCPI